MRVRLRNSCFSTRKADLPRMETGLSKGEAGGSPGAMIAGQYNIFSNVQHLIEFQRKIIDYCADALMVVDRDGRIVYINDSFREVHNVDEESVLNKHVTDIIDNTRMHIIAQTGMAEHDHFQDISGTPYVVSRIPIIEGDECVGVVGMVRFRYVEEVQALTEKIKVLQGKLQDMRDVRSASADTEFTFEDIFGVSSLVREAKKTAMQAARTEATVLLRGESGVGKEIFAQSIHALSHRHDGPFIRLNCSAIQETLIESELFGYEGGAFTGARKGGRKGKFELAEGGTIFLDEIGDMPLSAQAKLLRVIQEKEVDRLGSEKQIKVNVRILAATNRPLEAMVEAGEFREDLFYRLNVIPITVPSLRETPEEIPRLAKGLWKRFSKKHGIFHKRLAPQALLVLQNHSWKGNVRELNNVLERAMIMVRHDQIDEADIKQVLLQNNAQADMGNPTMPEEGFCLNDLVEQTERRALRYALVTSEGNRSKAARMLGISRPLLYKKINNYGLDG